MRFTNRAEAGRRLAALLEGQVGEDPLVLALPRGGVPVAAEVADVLDAPLDVIGVRKVGAPSQPELAVGAVAEGGGLVLDERLVRRLGIPDDQLDELIEGERREVEARVGRYRAGRELPDVGGRTVVVVDDGLATGSTARAAVRAVRALGASRVILAVPVCSASGRADLADEASDVVCVITPEHFGAVGAWYEDFAQTTDDEVLAALQQQPDRTPVTSNPMAMSTQDVIVTVGAAELHGDLTLPDRASGIVVFAHGSGSSRHSPRNRQVAETLQQAGLGTLLFDLLTDAEEQLDRRTRELRFDIDFLATRLVGVTEWLASDEATRRLRVGYFGASTGAAAALVAAARIPDRVGPVVSRGGRPDLAGEELKRVRAPVLLIVGGDDTEVLTLNREVVDQIGGDVDLQVVEGATHLFEEPGALDQVADLAAGFLARHLPPTS